MKNEDLLDLSISNREQEFVNKALDLELDVTIDIFEMLSDIPCIDWVAIKTWHGR